MRKTLIALLFAASVPAIALASPQAEHGPGPEGGRGGMLLKELDLSKQQRQDVGKLMHQRMEKHREIEQRYLAKLPVSEQKALQDELAAAQTSSDSAIRALLNPEQQKRYDQALQDMSKRQADKAEFEAWKAQRAKPAQ